MLSAVLNGDGSVMVLAVLGYLRHLVRTSTLGIHRQTHSYCGL